MKKFFEFLPFMAVLISVLALPLPATRAANGFTPDVAVVEQGDKPAPKPTKPIGPPKSEGE